MKKTLTLLLALALCLGLTACGGDKGQSGGGVAGAEGAPSGTSAPVPSGSVPGSASSTAPEPSPSAPEASVPGKPVETAPAPAPSQEPSAQPSQGPAPQPSPTPEASVPPQAPAAAAIDLAAFYEKMMNAAVEPPFMMPLEGEMLDGFYPGLTGVELKQCVVAMPAISAVAAEFAFVEVANAADINTVKAVFQARIDSVVNAEMNYPMTLEAWENFSEIVVFDNVVCLFVHTDKDVLIAALKNGTEVPAWCEPVVFDDAAAYGDEL